MKASAQIDESLINVCQMLTHCRMDISSSIFRCFSGGPAWSRINTPDNDPHPPPTPWSCPVRRSHADTLHPHHRSTPLVPAFPSMQGVWDAIRSLWRERACGIAGILSPDQPKHDASRRNGSTKQTPGQLVIRRQSEGPLLNEDAWFGSWTKPKEQSKGWAGVQVLWHWSD